MTPETPDPPPACFHCGSRPGLHRMCPGQLDGAYCTFPKQPPVSQDPWATVDEDHEGKCWMDDVNKARAADAALLRERDAQIASLTAQLAECYRLSGADPDGNEDWRLTSEPPKKWIPTKGCACSLCRAARLSPAPVSPVEPTPEPQPAEPKSSETRKPVVNLMEALKKSLDSLNANRTSQEPGGHQP